MEAIATPTATKTNFFDNLETPVIRKVVEDVETPILNRVLESETSDFLATQKDIKFNGNTSGLSEMSEENLNQSSLNEPHDLEGSDIQDGSPANFSKFSFNRTGGTGLDRSEIDEDFARLKIEGDTLKNSFEGGEMIEKLSKESLEPITGETLSRNSIPSGGFSNKVWCVYLIVIVSTLSRAEFGPNDHREYALHFTIHPVFEILYL